MSDSPSILLISCYELGHQPHGLASPVAFLERAGFTAETLDLAVEPFDSERAGRAWFVGISVPMHTALRLGVQAASRVRDINPRAHVCFYGLYATLNAGYLLQRRAGSGAPLADSVLGGEYESALVDLISGLVRGRGRAGAHAGPRPEEAPAARPGAPVLERLSFPVPRRQTLPGLERYAHLETTGGRIPAGYVEASRGCLHRCLHCPIPPVYAGRFFVVPENVVLEDVRRLVAQGAGHITIGDPDFLNGPRHSMNVVRSVHRDHPDLTFDITTKIEHILKHRELFPELADLGCAFLTSAVESLSHRVLEKLQKGHTRADVEEALDILDAAGVPMRPSLLPFTPWSTLDDFSELIDFVERRALVDQVDPVQYSIRLLVPPGSSLLAEPETRDWIGPLDPASFTYRWSHPDPRMDELQRSVSTEVERAACSKEDASLTFERVRALALSASAPSAASTPASCTLSGRPTHPIAPTRQRAPRLSESWFC